ncbi:phage antirepressor KilAC domain-containing protein [Domibacillus aminovorans]|uniref:phage antirepressor KilAC domain-containing protein n=1 Tax=Domibacillus aminovorans TaxID=29332 RepID=UPI003D1C16B6
MNELQKVFHYSGNQVRTIAKGEEIWFVAKDVCDILEINNPSDSLKRLDEDEKALVSNEGFRGPVNVINESGLYSLVLGSRKEEAKQFKRWITHEVLPTIRKTGGYVANDDLFVQTYLTHADPQTKLMFRATLETVRKQNEQIEVMQPKAEYFDALVDRHLLTNFRDTAKELKTGERKLINWLLEKRYLYRDSKGKLKPYAQYVPALFELKEWERNGKADVQTLVTPKGRETFRILLSKAAG